MGRMPGGGGRMPDDTGAGRDSRPQFKATVRWESALPVREAMKKEASPDFASNYVISVTGMPLPGDRRRPNNDSDSNESSDPEERRKMLQERLMDAASLQVHGRDPVAPDRVQFPAENNSYVLFLFPRENHPISLDDKEVTFDFHLSLMEMKIKFNVKDMVYHGKLEL